MFIVRHLVGETETVNINMVLGCPTYSLRKYISKIFVFDIYFSDVNNNIFFTVICKPDGGLGNAKW